MNPKDWLQFANIKRYGSRWSVSFTFTESDGFDDPLPFDVFVEYTKTKKKAKQAAEAWLVRQAQKILIELTGDALIGIRTAFRAMRLHVVEEMEKSKPTATISWCDLIILLDKIEQEKWPCPE